VRLDPRIEASEITPGLFVGSAPTPGPIRGVHTLILAAVEYQPQSALFPGVEVLHAGIDDAPSLSKDELDKVMAAAYVAGKRLLRNQTVLVTCAMGRNRSALIAALALCARYGMRPDESIKRLRAARGKALTNTYFEALLRQLCPRRA
jgi:protein-tyrosine phosphatase